MRIRINACVLAVALTLFVFNGFSTPPIAFLPLYTTPTITASGGITSFCGSGSAALTASGATGSQQYRWYTVPAGGISFSSSASFTTPVLGTTTSYYITSELTIPESVFPGRTN